MDQRNFDIQDEDELAEESEDISSDKQEMNQVSSNHSMWSS